MCPELIPADGKWGSLPGAPTSGPSGPAPLRVKHLVRSTVLVQNFINIG